MLETLSFKRTFLWAVNQL